MKMFDWKKKYPAKCSVIIVGMSESIDKAFMHIYIPFLRIQYGLHLLLDLFNYVLHVESVATAVALIVLVIQYDNNE